MIILYYYWSKQVMIIGNSSQFFLNVNRLLLATIIVWYTLTNLFCECQICVFILSVLLEQKWKSTKKNTCKLDDMLVVVTLSRQKHSSSAISFRSMEWLWKLSIQHTVICFWLPINKKDTFLHDFLVI